MDIICVMCSIIKHMSNTYFKLVKELRDKAGLSQSELAKRVGISRTSYVSLEKGTKELSLLEAQKLSAVFGISIQDLLSGQAPDYEKYKQMILLYIRDAKKSEKVIKKTKLAKLLYLADFAWYYEHLESMSGMPYRKIQFGPVPDAYFRAIEELEESGSIRVDHERKNERDMYSFSEMRGSTKTILDTISKGEEKLIHKIWKNWENSNTQEIVDFTHKQLPYSVAFEGEIIPYELITQEDPEHVY